MRPLKGDRTRARLLVGIFFLQAVVVSPAVAQPAPKTDWSKALVESTMKRYPTAADLGSWGYAKSLYLYGQYLVWKRTRDKRYLQYVKDWVDSHVDDGGNFFNTGIFATLKF